MRAAPSNLSLSFLRKAAPAAARLAAVAADLPEILIPFLSISILFLLVLLFIIFVLILFVGISTSAPSSQSSRRRSSVSRSCTMTSSPMASDLSVSSPPLLAVASPSPSETSRSHLAVPCPSQSPSDLSVPMLFPSPVPEVVTDACYFTAIEPCSDTIYICDETFGKPTEHNVKDLFEELLVDQAVRFVNSSTFVYTVSVPRKGIVLVHRFPIPVPVAECIADNQVLEQIMESFYAIGKQVSIPVCDRQSLYHLSSESLQINEEQLEKNISWADSGLSMSITNSDMVHTESDMSEFATDLCYFTAIEVHLNSGYRSCEEALILPAPENVNALFAGNLVGQVVRYVDSSRYIFTVSMPGKGLVLVHRYPVFEATSISNDPVINWIVASFYAMGKQVLLPPSYYCSASVKVNEEKNISWADLGMYMSITHSDTISDISSADSGMYMSITHSDTGSDISSADSGLSISITNSDVVDTDSDMSEFATDLCYFTAIEVHLNSGYRSCEEALILPAPENVNALFAGNLVGQVVRYVDSSRYIFTVSMPGKGLVLVHRYPVFEATSISNDPVINWIVASFYAMVKQVMLPPSYYCSASVEVNEENNISWADSGMYMSITHSDTISDISCADSGMLNADPEITCCMSNTDPDISCASSCMSNTDPDISCCMSNTDPDISCASSCMSDGSESDMSMGQKEVQKKKTKKVLVEKEEGKKKAVAHAPRRSPRLAEKKMQVKDADVSKDISKNRKKSRPVEEARPERRSPRLAEKAKGTGK